MTSVVRLLAPNPGVFTGEGTNTYIVVSRDECLIVDPGPIIADHRTRILEAIVDFQPRGVLVTHTHQDHAPMANPLAAALDIPAYGYAPGPEFDPDRRLRDGDSISFGSDSLEVLYTPGHSDDHLCFQLGDTLFTGDHVKGGTSVMVEDMSPYLDSLERLHGQAWSRMYPGHGPEISNPSAVLTEYIAHRLEREQQIVDALSGGAGIVGDIVQRVYHDVDPALFPLAAYTVVAHLRKLRREGRVAFDGDNEWSFEDHVARWGTEISWLEGIA